MSPWQPRRIRIANRHAGGLWWRVPSVLVIWILIASPIVVATIALAVLRDYAHGLPDAPDLGAWESRIPRTSVVLASDGTVLAEIPFSSRGEVGHRYLVAFEDLPEQLVQAVLAAEDVRFFSHSGVDLQAVVRAAWANYRAGQIVEGASTITQQVARNLLPERIGHERSLRRKVREALLARRIERRYAKQRIFEVYVNHAFLGANAYGVAAAARAYFSKPLEDLDLAETAMIAGLAQAPGRADPYKDPEAARTRRDEVLRRMERAAFVTPEAANAARARPIELSPPPLRYGALAPWHTERSRRAVEEDNPVRYRRGGLRIETTAQPLLAISAETIARSHSERLGKGRKHGPPQLAALVWDHQTGYVEATLGGLSWQDSQFDRATQACRQPGSAFKPLVYATAVESDVVTAGTPLRDAPIAEYDDELGVYWKPTNSGRSFRGVALAHDALALSLNAPAVYVLDRVGSQRVVELARRLGISTKLAEVRPMALGASCVVPIELARAFTVFARQGTAAEAKFVLRVTRGTEVLLYRASHLDPTLGPARRIDRLVDHLVNQPEELMDARSAFVISNMLRDAVRRGTATGARSIGRPAAGKTGTTNKNTDAWFVGYTGRLISAVWIGHDNPAQTLGPRDDGGHAALPLWNKLIKAAEGDRAPVPVPGEPPPEMVLERVDRETGLLAQPGAGGAVDLYFKRGTEPTQRAGQIRGVPTSLGRTSREF